MIAVGQPDQLNRWRQLVAADILSIAHRVPLALHDQRRRLNLGEVCRPCPLRLAQRVERIAEADEPEHTGVIRDHRGDATAHRTAADDEAFRLANLGDRLAPGCFEHGRAVRRAALPRLATPAHVRELEAHDPYAGGGEPAGDRLHPRGVHRQPRPVGEHERPEAILRPDRQQPQLGCADCHEASRGPIRPASQNRFASISIDSSVEESAASNEET